MIFKKTVIIDINFLPGGYEKSLIGVKKYAKDFKVNVIPFDGSTRNTNGSNSSGIWAI